MNTSGAYVELTPGADALNSSETSPTVVTSQDLWGAANFNTLSQSVYEMHVHTNTGSVSTIAGGGELRPSGSFTGFTTITSSTIFSSGTWVDENNKLRTTASVAVSSLTEFAEDKGADVYFYVSGTFGSGSSGDKIALFGGDVKISGTLAVGTGSAFIQDDRLTLTSASIRNVGGELTFFDDNNLGGQTLSDVAGGADADWTASIISGKQFLTSTSSLRVGERLEFTGSSGIHGIFGASGSAGSNTKGGPLTIAAGGVDGTATGADVDGGNLILRSGRGANNSTLQAGDGGVVYVSASRAGRHTSSGIPGRGGRIIFRAGDSAEGGNTSYAPPAAIGGDIIFIAGKGGFSASPGGSPHLYAGAGGDFRVVAGDAGEQNTASSYVARGGSITFTLGSGSNTGTAGGRDGDLFVSGGAAGTSRVAINNVENIGFGVNTTNAAANSEFGADTFFYVSGTFGSGSSGDKIAVFGGDVRISGTLAVGTGSAFIQDDRVTLTSASIRNVGGTLTLFDDNNLFGRTVADLFAGAGSWFNNSGNASEIRTTASVAITSDPLDFPSSQGDDVYLYVSGTVGAKNGNVPGVGLFGGDVHISGNLTVDGSSPGGGGDSFFYSDTAGTVKQSGSLEMSGSGLFKSGLSGALNVVADGSPYLLAGSGITLGTGSKGQVTIAVTGSSNGYAADFNTGVWALEGANETWTISGSTHGLGTSNLQIQLFQSTSNGHILTTAQETRINAAFDVRFTISSGSSFPGQIILLKAGTSFDNADSDWTVSGSFLTTTSSIEVSGNVAVGGQAYPVQTGSLTLTGSSLVTDLNSSNTHFYTLTTGGLSLSTASNQQAGGSYIWMIRQDGTGDNSLSFDANFFTVIGSTSTIITGANKTTILSGISDGSKIFLAIAGDES
jgi:hypothetical protein